MKKNKLITKYKKLLKPLVNGYDTESCHEEADQLLVQLLNELGYSEITEIYQLVKKWYA